jgi:hypothetical protein
LGIAAALFHDEQDALIDLNPRGQGDDLVGETP